MENPVDKSGDKWQKLWIKLYYQTAIVFRMSKKPLV
jgi:hypothetical protein